MIRKEEDIREEHLLEVAKAMMTAARTAPKACGKDDLEIATVTGARIRKLAEEMRRIGELKGVAFFMRDAANVDASGAVVLIGMRDRVRELDCGICGYGTCAEKVRRSPRTACSFVVNDLGIALGSAVGVAADHRVDNRIMYSAGVAAGELGYMPDCRAIFAIPLSVTGKSIFFDRKHNTHPAEGHK